MSARAASDDAAPSRADEGSAACTLVIPVLRTGRLVLRPHRLDDFDVFSATLAAPRAGFVMSNAPTRRNMWFAFANDSVGWVLQGFGQWAVDLHDGTHIGQTGIGQPAHYPEPELGWLLHDGHEGRGYASEAAEAALDWAAGRFDTLVSYIAPGNSRSVALAERLGARLDMSAPLPDGETHDETIAYRHNLDTRRKGPRPHETTMETVRGGDAP